MSLRHLLVRCLLSTSLACAGIGCKALDSKRSSEPYHSVAYRPTDPSAVEVKVSIENAAVYVMEGDRPLLVTATQEVCRSTRMPRQRIRWFQIASTPVSGSGNGEVMTELRTP